MTTHRVAGGHLDPDLLARYADPAAELPPDTLWPVEAHLEGCPSCRDRLGTVVRREPAATELLHRVATGLAAGLDAAPVGPVRRRIRRRARMVRWVPPALAPWIVMTVLVVATAVGFDLAARAFGDRLPSLVLLLAPVAPLLAVAAAWTRRHDPAHELVCATARAGLYLVFRRALAVLTVIMPVLVGAGLVVGASPACWLLPCLAFTTATLALGELVSLTRAAAGLALLWVAAVVVPSVVAARTPALLEPAVRPGWALVTAVAAVAWALPAVLLGPLTGGWPERAVTWLAQPAATPVATVTAGLLVVAGTVSYAICGSRAR